MNQQLRKQIFDKYNSLCAYTGKPLQTDWQVDHIIPRVYRNIQAYNLENHDDNDNLVPCNKIVNHYKRSLNLEEFRERINTFHNRLAKVAKNPVSEKGIIYKAYMLKVADAFDITTDKPFPGIFYFEILKP